MNIFLDFKVGQRLICALHAFNDGCYVEIHQSAKIFM